MKLLVKYTVNFDIVNRKEVALQKKALRELRSMFETTAYFDSELITSILMVRL